MKVIITGAGQLAWELYRTAPAGIDFVKLSREELDITSAEQIEAQFDRHKPTAVINAAAYTAVDKAEQEKDTAFAVNAKAVDLLARQCQQRGAYLLHISTDFVFDGQANRPYTCSSEKHPLGVYGASKSEGEDAIAEQMQDNWAIIRTAWVYSSHGKNFVKTMLRLMAEKPQLGVVGDQVGTPTWAKGLAQVCWGALEHKLQGVYHWTDAGVASWYDFAVAIQRGGLERGLLKQSIPIKDIPSSAYPTPAERPTYSVLDKSRLIEALNLTPRHWQDQLNRMLGEL